MLRKDSLFIACFLVNVLLGTPSLAQSPSGSTAQLTLSDPMAVAEAESLSKAIDAVAARVRECAR
jgi:hypothetical protein